MTNPFGANIGDFFCSACGALNFASRVTCYGCGAAVDDASRIEDDDTDWPSE